MFYYFTTGWSALVSAGLLGKVSTCELLYLSHVLLDVCKVLNSVWWLCMLTPLFREEEDSKRTSVYTGCWISLWDYNLQLYKRNES